MPGISYRFLKSLMRWRKGAIVYLPPAVLFEWCESEGVVAEEVVIPEHLGESYMEKPEVVIRAIPCDNLPLPGSQPLDDLEDRRKALRVAERRLNDQNERLSKLVQERDEMANRLALVGCNDAESHRMAELHKSIERTERSTDQSSGEVVSLQRSLEHQPFQGGLDDERLSELRRLALTIGQYEDALEVISSMSYSRWSGTIRWTFGPTCNAHVTDFHKLVEEIGNQIPSQPVDEDELKTAAQIAENGHRPEPPRIQVGYDQLIHEPEFRALQSLSAFRIIFRYRWLTRSLCSVAILSA